MKPRDALTIVAFGDSITAASHQEHDDRWPEILRRELARSFTGLDIKLFNAGVGGNTSREGLARIEQDVLAHHPRYVLFEFGNDATPEPDRHVSLGEFRKNINLIIDMVIEKTDSTAVPMTFPPVIDEWHIYNEHPFFRPYGGQDACQARYRAATRTIAQERGLPLIDIDGVLRMRISEEGPGACILPDGVHLTSYGNQLVAGAAMEVLSSEIEKDWRKKESEQSHAR